MIIVYFEKTYKLKKEMRKRDVSIDEFQKRINFVLKMIYEYKDRSEKKIEDEIIRLKRLIVVWALAQSYMIGIIIRRLYKISELRYIPN
jgi:hypothetical protein